MVSKVGLQCLKLIMKIDESYFFLLTSRTSFIIEVVNRGERSCGIRTCMYKPGPHMCFVLLS